MLAKVVLIGKPTALTNTVQNQWIKQHTPSGALKGTVSRYKGRVLLFLKTFQINRKRDECGRHARASPDGLVTTCHRPRP